MRYICEKDEKAIDWRSLERESERRKKIDNSLHVSLFRLCDVVVVADCWIM
jgi:hypothetical protein